MLKFDVDMRQQNNVKIFYNKRGQWIKNFGKLIENGLNHLTIYLNINYSNVFFNKCIKNFFGPNMAQKVPSIASMTKRIIIKKTFESGR